jgi:hypothetical protein
VAVTDTPDLDWRASSFTDGEGPRVEVALLPDGTTAMRNGDDPDGTIVYFTPAEMDAFIKGAKAGEFDDLAE